MYPMQVSGASGVAAMVHASHSVAFRAVILNGAGGRLSAGSSCSFFRVMQAPKRWNMDVGCMLVVLPS